MIRALSALREAIGDDDKELAERKARELRRQRFLHLAGPRFAPDDGVAPDPARAMSTDCRLFSAFLHEAKPLKLRKAAIDNFPRLRSEPG